MREKIEDHLNGWKKSTGKIQHSFIIEILSKLGGKFFFNLLNTSFKTKPNNKKQITTINLIYKVGKNKLTVMSTWKRVYSYIIYVLIVTLSSIQTNVNLLLPHSV